MADRTLEILLKFGLDQTAAKRASDEIKKVGAAAEQSRRQLERMRQTAEQMQQVGMSLGAVGAAIGLPLVRFANQYVQAAGQAEATSRQWTKAMNDLQRSELRIGKVVAEQALPFLEKAVAMAEKLAAWAEEHPEIIKAALQIAGTAAIAGTGLTLAGGAVKTASTVGSLLGGAGLASIGPKIAGVLAAIPGLGVALAGGGGLALGSGIYNNFVRPEGGDTAGQIFGKGASLAAYGVGSLFGQGEEWFKAVARWTGQLEDSSQAAQRASEQVQNYNNALENSPAQGALVAEYANYEKQRAALENQYEAQRTATVAQYGAQRAALERQYEAQRSQMERQFQQADQQAWEDFYQNRARQWRDFAQQQAQAERDFAKQRQQLQQQLNLQLAQLTSSHNRTMQRLDRDHRTRVEDLTAARDALGLAQEQRRHAQAKADEQERYEEERAQNRADYARQLRELEQAFKEQQAARRQAFEQQQADQMMDFLRSRERARAEHVQMLEELQERFNERMKALEEEEAETLKKLKETQEQALKTLYDAFVERVRALDNQILGDYETYTQHLQGVSNRFTQWLLQARQQFMSAIANVGANTPRSGRASGGYADYGAYTLGEAGYEFVLAHGTTQALERAAGGRLSQEKILGALVGRQMGGRQAGQMIVVTQQFAGGSLSSQQRRELVGQARAEAMAGFAAALEMA